ncbi:MAG: nuclear transport factor 2 family protein [Ferruginibacter sp.]
MIKTIMPILLCCLLSSAFTFAQSADEKAVADAVENFRKLMLKPDKTGLENMAAEELSYGHSGGLIEDKVAFVDDIVTGKSVFKTVLLEDQTIKIASDVAIVRHHLIADTFNNNTAGKADLLVLLIWKKQNGQWKLLARQAAKSPAK